MGKVGEVTDEATVDDGIRGRGGVFDDVEVFEGAADYGGAERSEFVGGLVGASKSYDLENE